MGHDEIQQIFLLECDEGLDIAERGLLACKEGNGTEDHINAIFRAVHSIKGGAGAFGFTALQSFTHKFETVLQQVRDGDKSLTPALLKVLLKAFDTLADHASAIKGDGDTPDDSQISAQLEEIAESDASFGEEASDEAPVAEAATDVEADISPETAADDDGAADGDDFEIDFDGLLAELDAPEEAAVSGLILHLRPTARALEHGGDPTLLIRELERLGARVRDVDVSNVPDLDSFAAEHAYLGWEIEAPAFISRESVEEIFEFAGDACGLTIFTSGEEPKFGGMNAFPVVEHGPVELAPKPVVTPVAANDVLDAPLVEAAPVAQAATTTAAPASAASGPVPTIRVDLDRLDRLVDTVGELVITQSMLAQRLSGAGVAAEDELSQLEYLTRELQDCAMALRAQPIRSVFSRVPRIVRELEAETGKRVTLKVEGEATELDKTVIERIGEPLTHLIRNAIDHGLESVEDRLAAGKNADGIVRLTAEQRGGHILICVSDDGRGIDRERVLKKAIERKVISADARLADEEIDNLIFAPGFSTAEQVSNISGRGVGMDVVKQAIQALGGRVTIASTPGRGTTFSLSLPLTLAIADGMVVHVGGETLILPLTSVVESLQAKPGDLMSIAPGRNVVNVRGSFLPVLPLATTLGIGNPDDEDSQKVLIVVETEARGQIVLEVGAIHDQRQVVIKSLETNFRPVPGVAGATILGDGRIALIVDVEALASGVVPPPANFAEAA